MNEDNKEQINKSYYAVIPANVRYDERLPMGARFLYGEITALCNEKGYCWASNKYFADLYKVTKRTVINWINSLIEYGYVISDVKYKENSPEIEARYLKILHVYGEKNFTTPSEKNFTTLVKKFSHPSEKFFTENNTINNTCEYNHDTKVSCQKLVFDESGFNINDFFNLYNEKCVNLPKATKLTEKRKQKIKKRLNTYVSREWWERVFEKANASTFCKKGSWCTIDWLIANDDNPLKVFEGNYDDVRGDKNGKSQQQHNQPDKFANGW